MNDVTVMPVWRARERPLEIKPIESVGQLALGRQLRRIDTLDEGQALPGDLERFQLKCLGYVVPLILLVLDSEITGAGGSAREIFLPGGSKECLQPLLLCRDGQILGSQSLRWRICLTTGQDERCNRQHQEPGEYELKVSAYSPLQTTERCEGMLFETASRFRHE